jgi:hypothetical protein
VAAQTLPLNVPEVLASKPDRTPNWVVEPCYQFCQCALASSILAGHGYVFAGEDSQSRKTLMMDGRSPL